MSNDFKNIAIRAKKYFFGSSLASGMTFVATLLLARDFPLEVFGAFSLVQAIIAVIEGLTSSQSWQAFVKYYPQVPSSPGESKLSVGQLIRCCLITDFINAFLGLIVLIVVVLVLKYFDVYFADYLLLYGVVIPFRMMGCSQGLSRALNKLVFINFQLVVSGAIKLLSAIVVFSVDEFGLFEAVVGFAVAEICGGVLLVIISTLEVKGRWGFSEIKKEAKANLNSNLGVKRFIFINHFNFSLVVAIRSVDELVIGRILSLESVGIYKIIKLSSAFLSKLIEPMYIVIFPEFTRLLAESNIFELKQLLLKVTRLAAIAASVFLLVCIFGSDFALTILVGDNSSLGYWPMLIYCAGTAINMIFFYAHPLATAAGAEVFVLKLNIIMGISYLLLLWGLAMWIGLLGVAIAASVYVLGSTFFRLYIANKLLFR